MTIATDITHPSPEQARTINPGGNSVNDGAGAGYLAHLTDEQIAEQAAKAAPAAIARFFRSVPGSAVEDEHAHDLNAAMEAAGAGFKVESRPLLMVESADGLDDPEAAIRPVETHKMTVNASNEAQLGIVGSDYGIIQHYDPSGETATAFASAEILAEKGLIDLRAIEVIDGGARVRVLAQIGESHIESLDGSPNTLAHLAVFETSHNGMKSTTVGLYTLRLECLNGMTSRHVIREHRVRHTSRALDRMEEKSIDILSTLMDDVEAEREFFESLVSKRMDAAAFRSFATDFLGGEPQEDASKSKKTIFEKNLAELTEYFEGGNQGAGSTAWGAYNSVTRWVEAQRERVDDAKRAAQKWDSGLAGYSQKKIQKAARMLTR